MRCDEANPLLIAYAEQELPGEQYQAVETHIDTCEQCQADLAMIAELRGMAMNWHDEVPPPWQPPKITSAFGGFEGFSLDSFRQWFPTFASATALVMVALLFVQQPSINGNLPGPQTASDYSDLPPLPKATQAAMVQSVLESSRDERGVELQALLKVLKGEMDKRSIETEESLRYIIAHQLQGQQELDDLYQRVEALMHAEQSESGAAPIEAQEAGERR